MVVAVVSWWRCVDEGMSVIMVWWVSLQRLVWLLVGGLVKNGDIFGIHVFDNTQSGETRATTSGGAKEFFCYFDLRDIKPC